MPPSALANRKGKNFPWGAASPRSAKPSPRARANPAYTSTKISATDREYLAVKKALNSTTGRQMSPTTALIPARPFMSKMFLRRHTMPSASSTTMGSTI